MRRKTFHSQARVGLVKWKAVGVVDLRGVKGEDGVTSEFKSINVTAEVDTPLDQKDLDQLTALVRILAALPDAQTLNPTTFGYPKKPVCL